MARLIAVVGMVREARIIAGEGVETVIGGGDAAGLEEKLAQMLGDISSPDLRSDTKSGTGTFPLLLSFGVCGALSPAYAAGDLIVASSVTSAGRTWSADAAWAARLAAALAGARLADIAAGDAMIGSPAAKRALREASGAVAVDMESHIVADAAQRHGLAFAVVRAVSDAADHGLPPAALAGLRPDGTPDIGAVLRSLARRPSQLPALLRTARQAQAGFSALERAAAALRPPRR